MKAKDKQRIEEIKAEMKLLINAGDTESDHAEADDLLCEALRIYGQNDLVDTYEKIGKWYA